jgi:hypothetical protein
MQLISPKQHFIEEYSPVDHKTRRQRPESIYRRFQVFACKFKSIVINEQTIGALSQGRIYGHGYDGGVPEIELRRYDMLHLEQTRSRVLFMAASTIATAALMATIPGINAVGVLLAAAVINIPLYYSLPDRSSKAYTQRRLNRFYR